MRGKPKFKEGATVSFTFDGKTLIGTVFVVDKYGTFENPSDVSYDIMVELPEKCLYKHIDEKLVKAWKHSQKKN